MLQQLVNAPPNLSDSHKLELVDTGPDLHHRNHSPHDRALVLSILGGMGVIAFVPLLAFFGAPGVATYTFFRGRGGCDGRGCAWEESAELGVACGGCSEGWAVTSFVSHSVIRLGVNCFAVHEIGNNLADG
ncbi:hypothetical protein BJ742DRAFT_739047 [Cladochytrium replicatum]|nr:hypothetical protein BJ742DRAFT_739047 [Cladochytrium replicatum]